MNHTLSETGSPAEALWRCGAEKRIFRGNANRGLPFESSHNPGLAVKMGFTLLGFFRISDSFLCAINFGQL
jgi:hypothetical protein